MKLLQWCKANAMPVIAVLAAAVTAVFVPPDAAYLGYYDVKTLSCLLCVLAVVGALRRVGLFPLLAQRLVQVFHTTRGAVTALVGITLVGSMLLTNDTALLAFLPLSWFVLERTGQTKWTALTFILQNCAANLGGMLTPFGNPQNLYLFNHYNIPNGEFLSIMLPPFLLSTALILLCCLFLPREGLTVPQQETLPDKRRTAVYGVLFCVAVAMVLRGIPYWLGLLVIVMALLVLDRRALLGVDWGLLVTFAAFFTFSGNMARIEPVRELFRKLLTHGAMPVAALTSQVISNVPAAILLSQSMTLPFAMATTYNIAMSIGNRIKQARKKRGMSCKELAALVGVTPSAITNCENGISFPKPQVLCALFGALRVDANFLFQDYLP